MIYLIIISILISIINVNTLVPVAINTDVLFFLSRSQPYVNLIKQSHAWGNVSSPWQSTATTDLKTGWPTCGFSVVLSAFAVDAGGAYLLYAKCNAQISVFGDSRAYITNKTHDETTDMMTAVVNIPEGSTEIILSFQNTTGPGLQDIALLQPGYNFTSKSNITNLMLTHLSRFSSIRFNPWTLSNSGFETNWNERTPLDWPQYILPKHNPWETIPYNS